MASMTFCCISCTPCQLISFPDIFQMAETIGCFVCCINNCTIHCVSICINNAVEFSLIKLQLVVTIVGFCFEFSLHLFCLRCCWFTFNGTECKTSIFTDCQFFVVGWFLRKNIIGIWVAFKKSIFSFVFCSSFFSLYSCCDTHWSVIFNLFFVLQYWNIRYFHRKSHTSDIASIWIYVIRAFCKTGSCLLFCCRCECINFHIIIL